MIKRLIEWCTQSPGIVLGLVVHHWYMPVISFPVCLNALQVSALNNLAFTMPHSGFGIACPNWPAKAESLILTCA